MQSRLDDPQLAAYYAEEAASPDGDCYVPILRLVEALGRQPWACDLQAHTSIRILCIYLPEGPEGETVLTVQPGRYGDESTVTFHHCRTDAKDPCQIPAARLIDAVFARTHRLFLRGDGKFGRSRKKRSSPGS